LPVSWAAATDIGGKYAGSVAGTMGLAGQLGSVVMASAFGYILTQTKLWYGQADYELPVRIIGVIVSLGGLLWFMVDAGKPIVVDDED
jgi:nitrate/nitrite transporter NarK